MLKLLVNTKRHRAGSEVSASDLGEVFAGQLVAAGQAVEIAGEPQAADPIDAVLVEIFELEDQIDAVCGRRARIVVLIAGLGDDVPDRIQSAFATASRLRPELFGLDELPLRAVDLATEEGFDGIEMLRDRARIGEALMEALPEGYAYMDSPVEIISDLMNQAAAAKKSLTVVEAGNAERDLRIEALERDLAAVPPASPPAADVETAPAAKVPIKKARA